MSENRCVCCGEIIPEGSMVCHGCINRYGWDEKKIVKKAKRDAKINEFMRDWGFPIGFLVFVVFVAYFVLKGIG